MKIHQLDKALLINETQLGTHLNQSVSRGQRADFALLLAMLSPDLREHTPLDQLHSPAYSDAVLRQKFEVPEPQPLAGEEDDYPKGEAEAMAFHEGGLSAAHLQHYTLPSALTYPPLGTFGYPENLYHNFSGHQRRQLASDAPEVVNMTPKKLLDALTLSKRASQLHFQT
uniref:VC2046/SO_2500 family protein n=1 Tax=Thaumasiovibrio occultus TaxID=1891184 RepID=UPI000B34F422|nr:VC2046/SO_2500 family protein [Thaumasiovibrio occultus]